jgi:hypothetical protein
MIRPVCGPVTFNREAIDSLSREDKLRLATLLEYRITDTTTDIELRELTRELWGRLLPFVEFGSGTKFN